MANNKLPIEYLERYNDLKPFIINRLKEFKNVKKEDYFYEFCYCILTPQSKAKNAYEVQKLLQEMDFLNCALDVTYILRDKSRYIRFHNQKAKRLLESRIIFNDIKNVLESKLNQYEKRNWIAENINGFGLKESSHFLRNIGYRNLAILDRHILRHLTYCGIFTEIPKIKSKKHYIELENEFISYSKSINIAIDELDLLFWASSTGEILK